MVKLIVRSEGATIQELVLEPGQEYLAGREESCQIPLKGKTGISRQHFKIYFNGTNWQVDVLSKFGRLTFQGQQVHSITLENGNSFSLPPFDFQFVEVSDKLPTEKLLEASEASQRPMARPENLPVQLENDTLVVGPPEAHLPSKIEKLPSDESSSSAQDFEDADEKTFVGNNLGEPLIEIFDASGKEAGYFQLGNGTLWIFGRDESCDVKLPDSKASRKHFEISKTLNGYVITDLGSSNGTKVNGHKISQNASVNLNSGDIISVANLNIHFTIKNLELEQQIKNLPDVLFKQSVIARPTTGGALIEAHKYEIGPADFASSKNNLDLIRKYSQQVLAQIKTNPKIIIIGVLVIFIIYLLTSEMKNPNDEATPVIKIDDASINKLTAQQQQMIKESYALAQVLIQQGNFELAKAELDKIHALVPSYEKSKEMELQCEDAIELIKQQQANEAEKQRREAVKKKVAEIVTNCQNQFSANTTLDQLNSCLASAIEFDPENPQIAALQAKAKQQDESRALMAQKQQEYNEKVRKGQELLAKAQLLQKNGELYAALKVYKEYNSANYPDPQGDRKIANAQIETITKLMTQRVEELLKQAQEMLEHEDFKGSLTAIFSARKANPEDERIANTEARILTKQKQRLKDLYQDAKFEESLGNVQVTKEKCLRIMEISLPDNEYHKKCKLLLGKYGFVN